ncbi:MAG: type III-A CRISPR-associated RAMP protein Csm5 [Bacteroidales bacterium]|jgi:CRISPR-associated protein Csm5|nr:type III-A CRISPR-associated RAMP protein Csm5 [Bacteroidales bacterium]
MSNIKITTLTPIHVGSGVMLQNNTDFVQQQLDEDNYIGVVDDRRLMEIIGEKNIDKWVASINKKENTKDFIERCCSKNISIEEYSKRLIYCPQKINIQPTTTLKEYIHDGLGKAYIPGSSIKGAIRTAILIKEVPNIEDVNNKIDNKRGKLNAKEIEQEVFGKDPNSDCLRFLHIGDAYFNEGCEDALNMINLNIRERQDYLDKTKSQIIEVITNGEESTFNLTIDLSKNEYIDTYNNEVENSTKRKNMIKKLPFNNEKDLFYLINRHTQKLLESELSIWGDYKEENIVIDYINTIEDILNKVKSCDENSCILRIGHASGWRFITGAWSEDVKDDIWDKICKESRPGDEKKYKQYIFPKTRRINYNNKEVSLLGFVKLEINKNHE